jgi:hypothetical protein
MSRLSIGVVAVLGVLGLVAVIAGAARIVVAQTQAAAPATAAPAPLPAGAGEAPAAMALAPSPILIRELVRSVMPALISVFLLIPSGVVVLKKDRPAEHQRWATATISSIVTYWLS